MLLLLTVLVLMLLLLVIVIVILGIDVITLNSIGIDVITLDSNIAMGTTSITILSKCSRLTASIRVVVSYIISPNISLIIMVVIALILHDASNHYSRWSNSL
jgi:hypothetical protein